MQRKKTCEYCHEQYIGRANQFYCSPKCRQKAANERVKEVYPQHVENRKKVKRNSQLVETNRLAREAGMSYGKYMALKYMEAKHEESSAVTVQEL